MSGRARVRQSRLRRLGVLVVLLAAVALLAVDRLSLLGLVIHCRRRDGIEFLWWTGEVVAPCLGPGSSATSP